MEVVDYKAVYFTFGRFQPATHGHESNFMSLKRLAGSSDWFIFPSLTQNKDTDPLPVDRKIHYMEKGMSWTRGHVRQPTRVTTAGKNNPLVATIQLLQSEGYDKCYLVVGSDRVGAMQWTKKGNGTDYRFYEYDVISSGERDADGDTFAISGTKMRRAAAAGDFDTFKKGMPKNMKEVDARKLMEELKANMS